MNTAYAGDLDTNRRADYYSTIELNNVKLDPKLKDVLSRMTVDGSSIARYVRAQELLYLCQFSETDLIVTCFVAKVKGMYAIYGLLYSQWDQVNRKYVHKYVVPCPTYRSQDGEYRHRVIPYSQFTSLMKRFEDIYDTVDAYIVERIETGKLEFNTTIYYPKSFTGNDKDFENELDNARLPLTVFIHSWLCDFHQIHVHTIENHVNPVYHEIIYNKSGLAVYNAITKLLEGHKTSYSVFLRFLSCIYQDVNRDSGIIKLECGQKIFPLTHNEMVHSGDINYPVWREIYFAKICTDITVGILTPSFPVFNRYFYIQNSIHTLYDNPSQHEKFYNGQVSDQINQLLRNADRLNLIKSHRTSTYINAKFHLLSRKIHKVISYSQKNIQLVDVSICTTNEHCGRTIRDLPALAHSAKLPEYMKFFTNIDTFNKYMFEFLYGLYCVHSKSNLMHGDLHLNNATLYNIHDPEIVPEHNMQTYYIVDDSGKPIVYKFRNTGMYSMIIDMSRGVIADTERLTRDFGPRYTEMFIKEQNIRVMKMMAHYFPLLTQKYRERIEALVATNVELMFKILVCIDPYALCKNMLGMFTGELSEYPSIKVHPKIPGLLRRIVSMSELMFAEKMTDALNSKITKVSDFDWPCLSLIKELFGDYIAGDAAPGEIVVDIFNSMNPVKYSTRSYSTMPPLLQLETEMRLRKKHGIPVADDEEVLNEFNRDESAKRDILLQKYRENDVVLPDQSSWMFD